MPGIFTLSFLSSLKLYCTKMPALDSKHYLLISCRTKFKDAKYTQKPGSNKELNRVALFLNQVEDFLKCEVSDLSFPLINTSKFSFPSDSFCIFCFYFLLPHQLLSILSQADLVRWSTLKRSICYFDLIFHHLEFVTKNYSFQNPPLAAVAETVKKAFKKPAKNMSLTPVYWDQGNLS